MPYKVRDTVILDGIESVIMYDYGSTVTWGRYLVMDKNHDLSYYISNNDFVDVTESNGVINTEAAYGYEWGAHDIVIDTASEEIGEGLNNTNNLISLGLQSKTEGWRLLWDMVVQFRSTHSDKWFIPSFNELQTAFKQGSSYLNNLTTAASANTDYWSSTEYRSSTRYVNGGGGSGASSKYIHSKRSRLCRYTTDEELEKPRVGATYILDGVESVIIYDAVLSRVGEDILLQINTTICLII